MLVRGKISLATAALGSNLTRTFPPFASIFLDERHSPMFQSWYRSSLLALIFFRLLSYPSFRLSSRDFNPSIIILLFNLTSILTFTRPPFISPPPPHPLRLSMPRRGKPLLRLNLVKLHRNSSPKGATTAKDSSPK